jgi:prephenate dehydratase
MNSSKIIKENNIETIAFQGANGANSNLACLKFYPKMQAQAFDSFYEVFKAVENNEAKYGMIPLENSYAGRVAEIHDLLQKHDVSIVAEHFFPITHNLVGLRGAKLEDIKEVLSHPQALMQSQENLRKLAVKITEFSNTAKAAERIATLGDKSKGALCSKLASDLFNLEIIKENMQDSGNDNVTIFIVISKHQQEVDPQKDKIITALLFTIRNIPGALYKALGGFATNGVSLVKLESYIPSGASKQAKFFISIEGHPSERNVALGLEELGFFSKNVKLLGVYYADKARFL